MPGGVVFVMAIANFFKKFMKLENERTNSVKEQCTTLIGTCERNSNNTRQQKSESFIQEIHVVNN